MSPHPAPSQEIQRMIDALQQTKAKAQRLCQVARPFLPDPSPSPNPSQPLNIPFPIELLPSPDFESFSAQLTSLGLSSQTCRTICHRFDSASLTLAQKTSEEWRRMAMPLSASVASAMQSFYGRIIQDCTQHLLQEIRTRVTEHGAKDRKSEFREEYVPFFRTYFAYNAYPSLGDRSKLAKISGMEKRQIDTWFQNERARAKRSGKSIRRLEGDSIPHDYNAREVEQTLRREMGILYNPPENRRRRIPSSYQNLSEPIAVLMNPHFKPSELNPEEIDRSRPSNYFPPFKAGHVPSTTSFDFKFRSSRRRNHDAQPPPVYQAVSGADFEDLSFRFSALNVPWRQTTKKSALLFEKDCTKAPHPAVISNPDGEQPLDLVATRRVHTPSWMQPTQLPVMMPSQDLHLPPPTYPSPPPAYSSPLPAETTLPTLLYGRRRKTAGLPRRALKATASLQANDLSPQSRRSSSSSMWSSSSSESSSPTLPLTPLSTSSITSTLPAAPAYSRFSDFASSENSWQKASRLGSRIPLRAMFNSSTLTNAHVSHNEVFPSKTPLDYQEVGILDPAFVYHDVGAIDTSVPVQIPSIGAASSQSDSMSPFTAFDGLVNFPFDTYSQPQNASENNFSALMTGSVFDVSTVFQPQVPGMDFGLPSLHLDLNLDDIFSVGLQQQMAPTFDCSSWQVGTSPIDASGGFMFGSFPEANLTVPQSTNSHTFIPAF